MNAFRIEKVFREKGGENGNVYIVINRNIKNDVNSKGEKNV